MSRAGEGMFKSVRIQNFRQFKDLKLDGLAQINLITGKNNTGKTSLLEALFLLDNPVDPTRTLPLASFRGIPRHTPQTPELWEWLFRNRDYSRPIEIAEYVQASDANEEKPRQRLRVLLSGGSFIPTVATNGDSVTGTYPATFNASSDPVPELRFDYLRPDGKALQTDLKWTTQGLYMEPDRRGFTGSQKRGFFLSTIHAPNEIDADRFSRLEEQGQGDSVVEAMRIIEPRLRRLTVLSYGGRPTVAADIGEYPLVPLAVLGQGFSKLFTIVTGIVANDGPIMFIDEFGGGFHYSILSEVWKVIVSTALEHSVQIFATTHSLEAIEAAVEGSEGQEGSLAFFRLERSGDGIQVIAATDDRLRSAVGLDFELR
jgi:hypothetical protein